MISYQNLYNNSNMIQIAERGNIKVFEHQRDLSVTPGSAMNAYFAAEMNIRKRQVLIELKNSGFTVQAGAMQWTAGNVKMGSGIKGVGDFFGKAIASKVTKEAAVKPEYTGTGLIMLEPTYKYILLEEVSEWGTVYSWPATPVSNRMWWRDPPCPQRWPEKRDFSTSVSAAAVWPSLKARCPVTS